MEKSVMIAVHEHQGKISACTEAGIICQGLDRYEAIDAILAVVEGLNENEILELLDTPTDPATFRAVWASAVSNSVLELEKDIDGLPNQETVEDILTRQGKLYAAVAELQRELLRGGLRAKIKEYETAVENLTAKCVAAFHDQGHTGVEYETLARQFAEKNYSPQLADLRQKLEAA
jgi:hypothetical protein